MSSPIHTTKSADFTFEYQIISNCNHAERPAGTRTCVPVTPSAIDETIKPKGFTDANTSAFAIIGALKSAAEMALIFKSFSYLCFLTCW